MGTKTKISYGLLILVILTSSMYVMFDEELRLDVQNTKTLFKQYIDEKWVLSSTERVWLMDGTTKMRAKSRLVSVLNTSEGINIIRDSLWKDNIKIKHTYEFDSSIKNIEQFPINEYITVYNATGKILKYEIRDFEYTDYTGRAGKNIESPFSYGNNMKLSWNGSYYAKIFNQKSGDKIIIKFRVTEDNQTFNVRMFDPVPFVPLPSDLLLYYYSTNTSATNVIDESDSDVQYNGTASANVTFLSDGITNFDSSGDGYINTTLNFSSLGLYWSMTGWFQTSIIDDDIYIIGLETTTPGDDPQMFIFINSDGYFELTATSQNSSNIIKKETSFEVNTSEWWFFAVTYSNVTMSLYINTTNISESFEGFIDDPLDNLSYNLVLGAHVDDGDIEDNWEGNLSNFLIYNVTLTEAQITTIYNLGRTKYEIVNLTVNGSTTDFNVELGTVINVNASISPSTGTICIDINHHDEGVNVSCDTDSLGYVLNITEFRKTTDNESRTSFNMTYIGPENNTFYLESHQYDELINITINLTGFKSNDTFPVGVKLYINNTLSNDIGNLYNTTSFSVSTFSDDSSIKYINLTEETSSNIANFKIPKIANVTSATMKTRYRSRMRFNITLLDNQVCNVNYSFAPTVAKPLYLYFIEGDGSPTIYTNTITSGEYGVSDIIYSDFGELMDDGQNYTYSFLANRGKIISGNNSGKYFSGDFEYNDVWWWCQNSGTNLLDTICTVNIRERRYVVTDSSCKRYSSSGTDYRYDIHTLTDSGTENVLYSAVSCGGSVVNPNSEGSLHYFKSNFGYIFEGYSLSGGTDATVNCNNLAYSAKGDFNCSICYDLPAIGYYSETCTAGTNPTNYMDKDEDACVNTGVTYVYTDDEGNNTFIYSQNTTFSETFRFFLDELPDAYFDVKFHITKVVEYPTSDIEVGTFDGVKEWTCDATTCSFQSNVSDFSSEINSFLSSCTADSEGFCEVPVYLYSDDSGQFEIYDIDINYTYEVNPVTLSLSTFNTYINSSTNDTNVPIKIEASTNGTIQVSDIKFDYFGGNKTYQIKAHNTDYTLNKTLNVTYYSSSWEYSLPTYVDYIEFIPRTPTSKNVTPYKQTDSRPMLNITMTGYGGKNMNFSMYQNETYSCVNLTVSATNNKSDGTQMSSATWYELVTDKAYLYNYGLWFWADFGCNYTTWRDWEPDWYFKSCCVDCVCSEAIS